MPAALRRSASTLLLMFLGMIASSVHAAEKEADHVKIMEEMRAREDHVGVWQRYGFAGIPLVPPGRDAPKIDGVVDMREWAAAAQLGGMMDYNKGMAVRDKTAVSLCYTSTQLYMAFQIGRPQNARAPADQDLFEILIDASHQQGKYYNLAATSTKIAWTGVGPNVDKKAWQPAVEYKARATEFGWEGELAIPFKEFKEGAPAPGTLWGIDFVRNEKTPTDRLAVWSFRGRNWHATKNLGHLLFTGKAVAVRAEGLGWIEGSGQHGVKLRASNFSDQPVTLDSFLELRKAKGPVALEFYPNIDTAMTEDLGAAIGSPLKDEVANALKNYTVKKTGGEKITIPPNASKLIQLVEPEEPGSYLVLYAIKDGGATPAGGLLTGGLLPFQVLVPLAIKVDSFLYSANAVAYEVDLRRVGEKLTDQSALVVAALDKGGKTLAQSKHDGIQGKEELSGILQFAPQPDAMVFVRATVLDGAKEIAKNDEPLRIPAKPVWLGNQLGKKEFVPDPWKPVQASAKACEVLLAKYAWDGKSILPDIQHKQHAIFTKPPALTFKDKDGHPLAGKLGRFELTHRNVEQATYEFKADLDGKAELSGKAKIEFDGLVWYSLALKPKTTLDLAGCSLEFTLNKPFNEYCTTGIGITSTSNVNYAGWIPAEGLNCPYTYMFWVGGVEGGLQWFAENNRNWFNASEHNAVQITRTDTTASLKINFIDKLTTLDRPTEWSFGFLPTPTRVKPKGSGEFAFFQTGQLETDQLPAPDPAKTTPEAFWDLNQEYKYYTGERWKHDKQLITCFIHHGYWQELFGYPGTFEPPRQERTRKSAAFLHGLGVKTIVYAGWGMHTEAPEWKDYGMEMVSLPLKNMGYGTFRQGIGTPWQDWFLHKMAQMTRDYDIDGIFIDSVTSVTTEENYTEGVRWVDAQGKLRGSYPLLATREWLKRLYKLWHGELKKDGLVYNHNSPPAIMMIENFEDVRTPSEFAQNYDGPLDRKFLGFYIAKNGGEQFGLFVEHTSKDWMGAWARRKTNQLYSFALPLNNAIKAVSLQSASVTQPSYALDAQPQPWIWAANKWVNRSAAEYLPWWKNSGYVTTTPNDDQIIHALWLQKGEKALLCVSNLKNEPRDIQVALNLGALGFNKIEVKDAITGEQVPAEGGKLSVKVDFERYRLLKVTNAK
ncbi:MAG: hypothetical protein HY360_06190 [Verrucomicrobia bacterium]|nr:hypothetical protein [Verrucomicrobiota bacterium]